MKDIYWHLQMHLPDGPNTPAIDPLDMLKEPEPVIGTGEWDSKQCPDFKNMPLGSIVMVRIGKKPLALCEVTGENFTDSHLTEKYRHLNFRHVRILNWNQTGKTSSLFSQGTLKPLYKSNDTLSWHYIDDWYKQTLKQKKMERLTKILELKKQIILQGAPGTGKTYTTAALALSILSIPFDPANHSQIMQLYHEQVEKKHIQFTTFHQSMDYEDFIEGLKPEVVDSGVVYKVEDGIFKRLCQRAGLCIADADESNFNRALEAFRERCVREQEKGSFLTLQTKTGLDFQVSYDESKPNSFRVHPMKSVKEDPWYSISTDMLSACYTSNKIKAFPSYIFPILDALELHDTPTTDPNQRYVLIIDEINRGNISKLFGELITLLENDKRSGGSHPLKATLPYSKENFEIPSNLYIIGTMNTTDRSVGFIDYAVRRRFAFYTLAADPAAIASYYGSQRLGTVALDLFKKIRAFIVNHKSPDLEIDDLMIGHSYFMANNKEELLLKLEYEMIPLIREYDKDGILTLSEDERSNLGHTWIQQLV